MIKKRTKTFQSASINLIKLATTLSLSEFLQNATETICDLTNSPIGFFHTIDPDQKTISIQAWSSNSSRSLFGVQDKDIQLNLEEASQWSACIRERRTIIRNNLPDKTNNALSTGRDGVMRELVAPVVRGSLIVAILGVGNKPDDYDENDADLVSEFADLIWNLVEQKRKEECYQNLIDFTYDWETWIGLDGNFKYCSPSCERITGYTRDKFLGSPSFFISLVHPEDRERVEQHFKEVHKTEKEASLIFRLKTKNNGERWIEHICQSFLGPENEYLGRRGSNRDVTQNKSTELALKKKEDLLENSQQIAHMGSYEVNLITKKMNFSGEVFRILGLDENMPTPTFDERTIFLHPEDEEWVSKQLIGSVLAGNEFDLTFRIVRPGGEIRFVRNIGKPKIDENGEFSGLVGTIQDITDKKIIENNLVESEERFRALVENVTDIIFSVRVDGIISYVSPILTEILGYELNEAIGKSFLSFLHPDDVSLFQEMFAQTMKSGEKIDGLVYRVRNKNGSWQWHTTNASINKNPKAGTIFLVGISRNITESKLAEQRREAERELMNICHFASNKNELLNKLISYFKGFTGCDAVGVRLHEGCDFPYFANEGFDDDFIKTERSLLITDSNGELVLDSSGRPMLDCMCGNILCGRFDSSKPFFTANGSFWSNGTTELLATTSEIDRLAHTRNHCNKVGYESVALIPLRSNGRVYGLFQFNDMKTGYFTRELIDQLEYLVDYVSLALANLESAEALRESEEKYRILVENASEAICVLQNGTFKFFNPKMEEISGFSQAELMKKSIFDLLYPEDRSLLDENIKNWSEKINSSNSFTCRIQTRSGDTRWVELNTAPISWMGKPATLNFLADITGRKVVQDALINSEIRLRDLIDNFDGSIWAVDKNFRLISFNANYQKNNIKYFGYEANLGDDVSNLPGVSGKMKKEWQEYHKRVMNGENFILERETTLPTVTRFDEMTFAPIRNVESKVIGMTVMIRDISQRRKAELERRLLEEKFFNAFHTSPDSININRLNDGLYIDINEGFTEMTGYTAEEVIGKTSLEINIWADPKDRERMVKGLRETGEVLNLEAPFRVKNGQTKICLMSAKIIKVNDENCVLSITRDISDRKLVEAKLNEQVEELRRWHAVTLGRETRILDLKNEVNEILMKYGEPPRYSNNEEVTHV